MKSFQLKITTHTPMHTRSCRRLWVCACVVVLVHWMAGWMVDYMVISSSSPLIVNGSIEQSDKKKCVEEDWVIHSTLITTPIHTHTFLGQCTFSNGSKTVEICRIYARLVLFNTDASGL